MKSIIMIMAMTFFTLLPKLALAAIYNCSYETDNKKGRVSIKTNSDNDLATVKLIKDYKNFSYSNCLTSRDEFGLLIDCKSVNLDFMVLIGTTAQITSGGIMSTTHDLFVDIDC